MQSQGFQIITQCIKTLLPFQIQEMSYSDLVPYNLCKLMLVCVGALSVEAYAGQMVHKSIKTSLKDSTD